MGLAKNLSLLGILVGALIVIVVSIVAFVVVPNIVDNKIKEETRLLNGTDTWMKWQNITIPISLRFYIFNITNPDADLTKGEKLNFTEHGPYVYDEHRVKGGIAINTTLDTVRYYQNITYIFNQAESGENLTESDRFNIPNIPLISVATKGYSDKHLNQTEMARLYTLMIVLGNTEKLVKKDVTAAEILFDGWDIKAYQIIQFLSPEDFPPDFIGLKFGLYRNKNGSNDGNYVVKNGAHNSEEFGKIVTWQEQKELNWWYTENLPETSDQHFCNKINGTDGSIFPPFNDKSTTLRLFNTDVCRSLYLKYESEMELMDIPGYRYTLPTEFFQHPDVNPDNKCFCPGRPGLVNDCAEGVIRIYPCKNGAPIVTSNPRFLNAGSEFLLPINLLDKNNEALRADPEAHKTFIEIEPDSGMLLRASKKIQINIELQNLPTLKQFEFLNFSSTTNSSSILLPIIWADEFAQLDEEHAQDLYDKLIKPVKIVDIAKWVAIAVGALVLIISAIVYIKKR